MKITGPIEATWSGTLWRGVRASPVMKITGPIEAPMCGYARKVRDGLSGDEDHRPH